MILRKLIIGVVATLPLILSARAQQIPQAANDTGLVLEVTFLKDRPPAFLGVARSLSKKSEARYARFGRREGWELPKGALPIRAVRLVPYLEGETVRVNVSVLRGQKFQDAEDNVASYDVRENEALTVSELETFGVEPFVIKLIRTSTNSESPTTLNKTMSVAVEGPEQVTSTLPHYKFTLRNLSEKNITALSINIVAQGRDRIATMPQGEHGEQLIKTGESRDLDVTLAIDSVPTIGGSQPSTPSWQQIVIESVVFEDGSWEGELKPAAVFLGFVVGRRIELRRILPLLDGALSGSATAAADELHKSLRALSYDADEAEVSSLGAAFSALNKKEQRTTVEAAIHGVRKGLLDQLEGLQKSEATIRDINKWLVRTRRLYSDWLARLNAVNISQR